MASPEQKRDQYRRIAYRHRSLPAKHGLRPHTVEIIKTAYRGANLDGERYETVTAVTESGGYPPKVRQLNSEELAVGALPTGTIEIGPITPEFTGGGTALSLLGGEDLFDGNTFHIRITGPMHPDGARYRMVSQSADRALHYTIRAVPIAPESAVE